MSKNQIGKYGFCNICGDTPTINGLCQKHQATPKSNKDSIEDKIANICGWELDYVDSDGFNHYCDYRDIDRTQDVQQLRLLMLGEVKKELSEAHRAGNTLGYDNATDEYIDERIASIESEEGHNG